ncbi:hypothetical protein EIZ62_15785 [Streptomyces ficellus]|uniref:Uncharacterized protein n=2 Tax=Streptomyces ficellus TaxID=1977088 RepID=A0A6I6FX46_9ACTN|nr:hypothetical protein EIZ62_15785 [Streptomyces ficellus]
MPLCAACTTAATGTPDRDPVRLGDILRVTAATLRVPIPAPAPRPPGTGSFTTCRSCGSPARRHRTAGGRWVALEPGERPVAGVPRAERWYVAADGTAVPLRGAAPSGRCRVTHLSVCPARP